MLLLTVLSKVFLGKENLQKHLRSKDFLGLTRKVP